MPMRGLRFACYSSTLLALLQYLTVTFTLSSPNPGRSDGLTQLWVLRKDSETGAWDKSSMQKVPFNEELYEVAGSIRWFRFANARLYQLGLSGDCILILVPNPRPYRCPRRIHLQIQTRYMLA